MYLSIILPAFNEENKIQQDLDASTQFLSTLEYPSEVVVVDDGSQDQTSAKVRSFIDRHQFRKVIVRLVTNLDNRGKGYAIKRGILEARGKYRAFVDSGLCVPYGFLMDGLKLLEKGYDYAIASRRLNSTRVVLAQPLYRRLGSRLFGYVVHQMMGIDFVSDTQCGFKIYKSKAAERIFSEVTTEGFMFDIEVLLIARRLQLKGAEFPIQWKNDSDTRYHPLWGTWRNFRELLAIQWRFRKATQL